MKKVVNLVIILIFTCASCQKVDNALANHFVHLEKMIDAKTLLVFKAIPKDSIDFIADKIMVSRSHCDSICQVSLINYFEQHTNASCMWVTEDWFLVLAFQKWLNKENINHDEIMQMAKRKTVKYWHIHSTH
jgi:hypothetical protein